MRRVLILTINAHVHLMYDSGPDLLTRAPQSAWVRAVRQCAESAS
jgi:hypothetical protein